MKRIKSFEIDHDCLVRGLYLSRRDGDVVTYDIRTRVPNCGDYMSSAAMHTVEHLFATYVRNHARGGEVVYFGPMGCRTGFYLLLRDTVSAADAIALVRETFAFIAAFDGKVPGTARRECGNYLEHDLPAARHEASQMCEVLAGWSVSALTYPSAENA